jgi:hypothetical protein
MRFGNLLQGLPNTIFEELSKMKGINNFLKSPTSYVLIKPSVFLGYLIWCSVHAYDLNKSLLCDHGQVR